jgi:tetratricopeptide (TPR) repeat protein
MKEKTFNIGVIYFILFFSIIFAILCFFFIFSNLRANLLYEKAIIQEKPTVKSEKIAYYRKIFSLLSAAININRGNADCLVKKADYILEALDEDLGETLMINEKESEDLYKKAIALNPFNFEYHLKLGWFYVNKNNPEAEEELSRATKLYPTNSQVYLYLCRYYLKNKNEKAAFNGFILALNYAERKQRPKLINEMEKEFQDLPYLSLNKKRKELKFIAYPQNEEWNFKKEGFAHAKITLSIKVYVKEPLVDVNLYKDSHSYGYFRYAENAEGINSYELILNSFPLDTYLDDFRIKTNPPSTIEKIEFIKKL